MPSPPSATGIRLVSAWGNTFFIPFSMDSAASMAVTLPLNESGAITILIFHHSIMERYLLVFAIILPLMEGIIKFAYFFPDHGWKVY
ncbi:hypothetical protein MHB50_18660 [Siminovitchia sp. FSL H7-0308]|uniref:hypothetical protein n=1 Tax=Siminovitchia sp. FSL H7-0308 TaxID=2921432 RepID=UPI0030EC9004